MPYFLKHGSRFTVATKEAIDLHDTLPADTYTVRYDKMGEEYYLEIVEGFSVSGKLYGDTTRNAERILSTFDDRPASTGVILSGDKGSGKTLLAKVLSVEAMKRGYPTIIINNAWFGDLFNTFMQMIEQPTVVIFDEFEKVYNREQQEKLLTLLDGVYPSKKLFILTCNDRYRVDAHMRNRPGRIFYRIDYAGLDAEFIREYCADNLDAPEHAESIVRMSIIFSDFNFDILKAMVEEMNRYEETPQQVIRLLNAKPELGDASRYELTIFLDGEQIDPKLLGQTEWHGNPLGQDIALEYEKDGDTDEDEYHVVRFRPADLTKLEGSTGSFHFQNSGGDKLLLVRKAEKSFDWMKAF